MTASSMSARRLLTATAVAASGMFLPVTAPVQSANAESETLPLGSPELVEVRTTETLAPGVELIRIERGDGDDKRESDSWRVHVLRIDPSIATGSLMATHGPDLAHGERTTELVDAAEALAGVNASYFADGTHHPGNLIGLAVSGGRMLREPSSVRSEVDFLVDAETGKATIGRFGWTGELFNRRTKNRLDLDSLNDEPLVPAECAEIVDQTSCEFDGDTVRFTPDFDVTTPSGPGVEVVLGEKGCVLKRLTVRGTALTENQTSIQATGSDATALMNATQRGCQATRLALLNRRGNPLAMKPSLYGVSARHRLTSGGEVVPTPETGDSSQRHPRTIAGITVEGVVMLATIVGRQSDSVGTTLEETAAVADSLGMHDSVNLDGGASTTMSVRGELVNEPSAWSHGGERPVGDALVYVP